MIMYTPKKYCGNNHAVNGGSFWAWFWWTWKDYNWSQEYSRTGVRFCGFTFYLWKRSL